MVGGGERWPTKARCVPRSLTFGKCRGVRLWGALMTRLGLEIFWQVGLAACRSQDLIERVLQAT
jgi:hypothetical protein